MSPIQAYFACQQPTYSNRPTDSKAQCAWPALSCFPDGMHTGLPCSILPHVCDLSCMAGYMADRAKGLTIAAPTFVTSSCPLSRHNMHPLQPMLLHSAWRHNSTPCMQVVMTQTDSGLPKTATIRASLKL